MTSLEGKVIAITGAASGIGLATARLCAARGASISIADIRQEPLDVAVADIQQSYSAVKIYAKTVDVKNSQEVYDWLDETVIRLGPLTSAANLAGVFKAGKQIADTQDEDWDFVMDVNVKGVFNCIRAQLQRMDKDASIVNASSIAGLHGYGGGAAYSTSKHAIIGLTRSAAYEVGARNIRVNCIAPGAIDTPMMVEVRNQSGPTDSTRQRIQRMGTPDEVARLIAFLLSDESTYTTGACYTVDGGWTS
ncbi:oxidoreductase [Usnea florida]